jgi:AmmeMemoRadiSam system protein B
VSGDIRPPAVAGSFYPAEPDYLGALAEELLGRAGRLAPAADPVEGNVLGWLVPHAGLVYSGVVAAAGWRLLGLVPHDTLPTIVMLGTNHSAGWLDGVGAWDAGAWHTPLGDVRVDAELAAAIVGLGPPFVIDRAAHLDEHSIEVQLPLLQAVELGAAIVPLSVAAGTSEAAIAAGLRLGTLLAERRASGEPIVLAISTDMAHYPADAACARVTTDLLPAILRLDPATLARTERAVVAGDTRGLVCGMCGIQPTVLGLAALRAMGATGGSRLASATSADAGGSTHRTVGYLAVAFTG